MNSSMKFRELSVFVECSTGSTPTIKMLKKYIDLVSAFGYTQIYLGLTDAYKMEGEPYFNFCRGGYTTQQLQEIDAYAEAHGMELRVNIQVLGHLHYPGYHACYQGLFDTDAALMVGKKEVYDFIDKMFATMSKGVKSRVIHIGMDEVYNLGLGNYLKQHGYTDNRTLFLEHLDRVVQIAKKYNYTCEIWSDMFYRMVQGSDFCESGVIPDDIKDSLPEGVRIVQWWYAKQTDEWLTKQIRDNKALTGSLTFAASAMKSMGLAPNNQYSIETIEQQIRICQQEGVDKFMVTLWSDTGAHCSNFAVLPTLYAAAEMAKGIAYADIDKDKFRELVGASFDDFMLLDYLNNPFCKELEKKNARCYWGFLSDLFLGSYDMLLDSHSNEAYAALVPKYEAIEGGEYEMMFRNYYLYAKVLATKMNLGVQIREAYRNGEKESLRQYATVAIPQMIDDMKAFVSHFEDWWLTENMAFGVEVHHLFYGGQLRRWEYVAKRILRYLEDGDPIDEMEREYLPPSTPTPVTEDDCFELNHHRLISNCGY